MLRQRRLNSCALAYAVAVCVGCSPSDSPQGDTAEESTWAYEREFPGGEHPASLVLRLSATELGLAEQLILEQELRVQPGFEAEFPEYLPEDFENFGVVAIEQPRRSSDAAEGEAAPRKRLTLEPDRSGKLTIAALAVYFRAEGAKEESHFLTDEITVNVEAVEDLAQLETRPLRGIYETPVEEEGSPAGLWITLGVIGLVVTGLVTRRLLRRERKAPPPTPAHEIAYEDLRRLVAHQLVEKGEIELFFVHLSGILRSYIENRFEVHAPERTTEEFLIEASRNTTLEAHHERLGEFLSLSDQVKFARYEPDEQHIQGAFDTLKQFIEETRHSDVAMAA